MKNQLIEEINNFRRLSGILIKESGGEKALADLLIGRLVKSGEKSLPKEIGSFTTKNGVKSVLNVDAYKNLLTKSVLSTEEKDVLHTINKNIVREFGVDIFVDAIKAVTKNMGTLEAIALENKILKEFFDTSTANTLKSSLNIGQLKPETPEPKPEPRVDDEGPIVRWADDLVLDIPPVVDDILTVEQKNAVIREVEDVIRGEISMDELARINASELQKISQLQKLRENETGLELLKEKTRLEKELLETQRRNADLIAKEKELAIKEKEMEIAHKKNVNDKEIEAKNIQLKKERAELRVHRISAVKQILLILGSMKVLIIVICIYAFGWDGVWKAIKGFFTKDGFFGGESGGSNNKTPGQGRFN